MSDDALILTENLATYEGEYDHWQDVTGKQYHFPSNYIKMVVSGRPFIYYRGTRAPNNKRIEASYFGCGIIGDVFEDKTTDNATGRRRWYCTIQNYRQFDNPVGIKKDDSYLESVFGERASRPRRLNAVRTISGNVYQQILNEAGMSTDLFSIGEESIAFPEILSVEPSLATELWKPAKRVAKRSPSMLEVSRPRISPIANKIGDRAEVIVFSYLKQTLSSRQVISLRWVANEGIVPGYDILYLDEGTEIGVEVKGTTADRFDVVEISANEWHTAERLRKRYILALVVKVCSVNPIIELITDPYGLLEAGALRAVPMAWRLLRLDPNA